MKYLFALLICGVSQATTQKAPPSFKVENQKVIFIDMTRIQSHIQFDIDKRQAIATTEIDFITFEKGMPLFDLVPDIIEARVNGIPVTISSISAPERATTYRKVNRELPAGTHKLVLKNAITTNTRIKADAVDIAFWMSDLSDRSYLERYLPCNLEFDQYQLSLELSFKSQSKIEKHEVFTNGELKSLGDNHFKIDFPPYFTSSSFYLHMVEKDRFPTTRTTFSSLDGREIPLTIYTRWGWRLSGAEKLARKVLKELEDKLGAWGHPSLTIYVAGSGGMEHSGATITSMSALGHELIHSYFARGVMPVRGNSGWIDEAIASWRDNGYDSRSQPDFSGTSMGAHSVYKRSTDRRAYRQGAKFMEYLNHKLESLGGLNAFLKSTYETHMHRTITTRSFRKLLEEFSGINFTHDFNKYILGANEKRKKIIEIDNPYHKHLTPKQELELL